jgi:hypothetical protein
LRRLLLALLDHVLLIIERARPLVEAVARRDRDLASQTRRALSSVALKPLGGFRCCGGQCPPALRECSRFALRGAGWSAAGRRVGVPVRRGLRPGARGHRSARRARLWPQPALNPQSVTLECQAHILRAHPDRSLVNRSALVRRFQSRSRRLAHTVHMPRHRPCLHMVDRPQKVTHLVTHPPRQGLQWTRHMPT